MLFTVLENSGSFGKGQAGRLMVNLLELLLFPQLLVPTTLSVPLMAVDAYSTTMFVVPCPDMMVPPAGAVQVALVALAGNAGML